VVECLRSTAVDIIVNNEFNIVFLDVRLIEGDGFDVYKRVKATKPNQNNHRDDWIWWCFRYERSCSKSARSFSGNPSRRRIWTHLWNPLTNAWDLFIHQGTFAKARCIHEALVGNPLDQGPAGIDCHGLKLRRPVWWKDPKNKVSTKGWALDATSKRMEWKAQGCWRAWCGSRRTTVYIL